jgi:urate oxidase
MNSTGQLHSAREVKDDGKRRTDDDDVKGRYELGQYGYGKNSVKLLHVRRDGALHTIREYEVSTRLKLLSKKDFIAGDNTDIIATDTQKNIVYILAKKYGVSPSRHFLVYNDIIA